MTKAAFTAGPWKAHFEEAYYVTGPDLGRVAMMCNLKGAHGLGGRRSGNEAAANNRLIAAAPDLLAAVEAFIDYDRGDLDEDDHCAIMIDYADALALAKSAFAKATGSAS